MGDFIYSIVTFLAGVWMAKLHQSKDPCEHFAATIYFPFRVWFRFVAKLKARQVEPPDSANPQ